MRIPLKVHDFSGWNVAVDTFQIISAIAVAIALDYAVKTYKKGRKLEQVKLANDILKDLRQQESKLPQIYNEKELAHHKMAMNQWISGYFDTWEWYAFLVNHKEIEYEGLTDYFKNSVISAYRCIFQKYASEKEKQDKEIFKEFKALYEDVTKS